MTRPGPEVARASTVVGALVTDGGPASDVAGAAGRGALARGAAVFGRVGAFVRGAGAPGVAAARVIFVLGSGASGAGVGSGAGAGGRRLARDADVADDRDGAERVAHLLREGLARLRAELRVGVHGPADDVRQRARDPGVRGRCVGARRLDVGAHDAVEAVAHEGQLPRQHLVVGARQGVDVGAMVDGLGVGQLLGRRVVDRAHRSAGLGAREVGDDLRDAEVGDLGNGHVLGAAEQDIGRLEVAVDDPMGVGVAHALENLQEDPRHLRDVRLLGLLADVAVEARSPDEFHDDRDEPRLIDDVVHADDVHVIQVGLDHALLDEAPTHLVVAHELPEERLDRDRVSETDVLALVDRARTALSQELHHPVRALEDVPGLEPVGCHAALGPGRQSGSIARFTGLHSARCMRAQRAGNVVDWTGSVCYRTMVFAPPP